MNQKRHRARKPLRLPVSLGGKLPALTADVSPDGFRVELPQVFLPGSKLDGWVLDGDCQLGFRGEVTWAQPGNPQLSLYSEMGVRFTEVSPELATLLARKPTP